MVLVVALDDDGRHAEVGDHAVQALLGGIVEAAVAELAGYDQRDGQTVGVAAVAGIVDGRVVLLAAGGKAEHHDGAQQHRE